MECIILAGGKGSRLGLDIPKALVKIDEDTILDKRLKQFSTQSITHFVLALGYKSEEIIKHVKTKYPHLNVDFSIEKELLGTGGAIKQASKLIKDEYFIATNVDDMADINIKDLIIQANKKPTIALAQFKSQFGIVITKGNEVIEFKEKPLLENLWASCGHYYLNKSLFNNYPDKFSIEHDLFPNTKLQAFKHQGYWITINTQKELTDAKEFFSKKH